MSNSRNVYLAGGGPWGVKLTGGKDFCAPLVVSKVTAGGKAALGGTKDGDYILMINDTPTEDLKHHDAQALIRNTGQSLRLTVTSVPPKRVAVAVETPTTSVVPNTRPAPPRAPPATTPTASPTTTPTAPTATNKVPPKVVHTTGGVTINVQKQKPPPPKSTNQQSSNVAPPPSRLVPPLSRPTPPVAMPTPAPPPSRPTPPVTMPAPPRTVVTPPVKRITPIQSPQQPNSDSGVITDSILTDDTDLNHSAGSTIQSPAFRRITVDDESSDSGVITDSLLTDDADLSHSSESTLQSPAFRRITIDDDHPHPSIISPPSTVIKPPVMSPTYHTPPPPSATVTKGILKSPTKPPPPASIKPPAPKPTTVAGINRPVPPPVTVVKAPPTTGGVSSGHGSKKEYESQAECAKCNNPIRGPYATAMNSNWHPDCFCCSACSKTLSNTTFVIEGNDVYCEQCYKQSVAPICEGCQQAITGNYMTAVGRYWHGEHFICCQCHIRLSGGEGGEAGFHYDEGRLYCPKCFTAANGVQCYGCKQLVGGNELWVEAMDHNWHPQCFVCLGCRSPLEGQSFFVKAGNPYCGKCK